MTTNLIYARLDKDGSEESPRIEETGARYECKVWNGVTGFTFPLWIEIEEREDDSGGGEETCHRWN